MGLILIGRGHSIDTVAFFPTVHNLNCEGMSDSLKLKDILQTASLAGDAGQRAECWTISHEVPGLILLTEETEHAYNPSTWEAEEGDQKFKLILNYLSIRLEAGLRETLSQQRKKKLLFTYISRNRNQRLRKSVLLT